MSRMNIGTALTALAVLVIIEIPVMAQSTGTLTAAGSTATETLAATPSTPVESPSTGTVVKTPVVEPSADVIPPPADISTTTTASENRTSVTLPEGVIYQVLSEGKGPEIGTTSTRLIHYTLYLPNGKRLESSRDNDLPVPFEFAPGSGAAIRGMELGTQNMRVGEKRKLYIPADLAYGPKAHGTIPPNSPLVFEIELVAIGTATTDTAE